MRRTVLVGCICKEEWIWYEKSKGLELGCMHVVVVVLESKSERATIREYLR